MKEIRAVMIVEIAGKPAEHIKKALSNHISQFKGYKGVKVISDIYSEPKKIENSQEMYTCFAEVEFEVESFHRLTDVVFDFMPASIEILSPSFIELNISDATSLLNTLSGRLHRYEEITGIAQIQTRQAIEKLKQMQGSQVNTNRGLIVNTNVNPSEKKIKRSGKKEN